MSNLENIYCNMEKLTDDFIDTEETKAALHALSEGLGYELYGKYEDEILLYATANEKQGFIYGFRYAVSLLTDGKVVTV